MTYNEQGKRTSLENLAGQVTTTAWDGWSVTYNGERVGTQGAAFGGTNVLRTVTAFYPIVANDLRSGFVASIRHEDGGYLHVYKDY